VSWRRPGGGVIADRRGARRSSTRRASATGRHARGGGSVCPNRQSADHRTVPGRWRRLTKETSPDRLVSASKRPPRSHEDGESRWSACTRGPTE
jgi:hypothetical protein